jgi:hypothetical protein
VNALRLEWRLLGWRVIVIPALTILAFICLAFLGQMGSTATAITNTFLTAGIEVVAPLSAALVVATAVGRDPLLEVHLSLPTPYGRTVFRRLALASIPAAALVWLMTQALMLTSYWLAPARGLGGHLIWLAPLETLTALVALLTILLRSAVVASALLVLLVGAQVVLHGLFESTAWLRPLDLFATTLKFGAQTWWMNREALLALAALAYVVTALLLQAPARLLEGE